MPHAATVSVPLYYQEFGDGPPIALIPGLGSDHRAWAPLLPFLDPEFRCISFDNRDSGQSGPGPSTYTIAEMAQDVVSLLDALAIERCHVIGVSMGGAIAQELAISRPERLDRLVLLSTYTTSDARGAAILQSWLQLRQALPRAEYLHSIYPWLYSVEDYATPGLLDAILQYALDNPYPQSPEQYERQMRAALSHDTNGRLHAIRAPTLLLFGEEDILTPLRFADGLVAEIPDVRLQTFPGTGHALLWTRTGPVAEVIRSFLKG